MYLRGPTGKCWAVELEQRRDGLFFCKRWPGFVKDHLIELEDFLIFYYVGSSEFDVTIYDRSCCEEDVKAAAKRRASDHLAETSTGGRILFKSENACYLQTLKPYNLYGMVSIWSPKNKWKTFSFPFLIKHLISSTWFSFQVIPKDIAIPEGLRSPAF